MFGKVRMEDIGAGQRLIVSENHYHMVEIRIEEDGMEDRHINLDPNEATALAAALASTAKEVKANDAKRWPK